MSPPERLDPDQARSVASQPSEPRDQLQWARLLRTALQPGQALGSAEITHPFHPFRGQRFVVLKIRMISGAERLSLRHAEMGSFAVRRDWTDWAPPGSPTEAANNNPPLLIDASGLLALSELVLSLKPQQDEGLTHDPTSESIGRKVDSVRQR